MNKEQLIHHIIHNASINSDQDLSTKLHGLSKGEAGLLGYLAFIEDNVSAGILSEKLKITSARVAKLLNTLEKKDYIIRIKDCCDKRKVSVKITEEGATLIHEMYHNLQSMISYIIDEIGMEEMVTYLNITNKIKTIIEEKEGGKLCCR